MLRRRLTLTLTIVAAALLGGCIDCETSCDRMHRDCLEDGRSPTACDTGYLSCLDSCE